MSVRHVGASKTPRLLGANPSRPRNAAAARPAQKSAVVPGDSKSPAGDGLAAIEIPQAIPLAMAEGALTDTTSGIANPSAGTPSDAADAAAQLLDAVGPASAPEPAPAGAAVDYHAILTRTIGGLALNNAETRSEVYERARIVVEERLKDAAPSMSSHMIAVERIAFDRAVVKVEAEQAERQLTRAAAAAGGPPPRSEPAVTVQTEPPALSTPAAKASSVTPVTVPPAPVEQADSAPAVVVATRSRPAPPLRQTHGGTLRLFALIGLLIAGFAGYWLATGKPDFARMRNIAHIAGKPPQPQPAETANSAPPAAQPEQPVASAPENPATADAASAASSAASAAADDIDVTSPNAYNVQLATFLSLCRPAQTAYGEDPCGNLQPRPFGGPGVTPRDAVEWVAMYASLSEIPMHRVKNPAFTMPAPEAAAALDNAAAPAPARSGNATARQRYERGMDLARNDNLEGAVADFSEAIRLDPKFADAYVQRGHAMFKSGNAERAIADFSQALQIDPRNVAAFKARGMAMLYKGDENGAIVNLTKAIQYAELDATAVPPVEVFYARRSRATLYSRKQLYERELADLAAMIDSYWRDPGLAAALRTTYRDQGAAALMASIYRLRAGAYQKRSDLDAAIGDLSLALQLDSQRALQYLIERGRLLEAAGRREQAVADYKQALELSPNNTDVRNSLARLKGP